MKFKFLNTALVGILLSVSYLSNVANAGLIEADIYGDGSNKGFSVQGSGLEWMDFGISNNVSYNYVKGQLGVGGVYEGWRIATSADMVSMVSSVWGPASFAYNSYDANKFGVGGIEANAAKGIFSSLAGIIGYNQIHTGSRDGQLQSGGWYNSDAGMGNFFWETNNPIENIDKVALANNYDYHWLTNSVQQNNSTMLVRAASVVTSPTTSVPEPSTLAIFALGIIGLASRRFKKKS